MQINGFLLMLMLWLWHTHFRSGQPLHLVSTPLLQTLVAVVMAPTQNRKRQKKTCLYNSSTQKYIGSFFIFFTHFFLSGSGAHAQQSLRVGMGGTPWMDCKSIAGSHRNKSFTLTHA